MPLINADLNPYGSILVHDKQGVLYLNDTADPFNASIFGNITRFVGIGVGEPSVETSDAVRIDVPDYTGGIQQTLQETLVGEIPTRWDFNIDFPRGRFIGTDFDRYLRAGSTCKADAYIFPKCTDYCSFWAFILPNANFRYISFGALVVPSESGGGVQGSSVLTITRPEIQVGIEEQFLNASAYQYTVLANSDEDDCGCVENCNEFFAGVRANDDSFIGIVRTVDRFASEIEYDFTTEWGSPPGGGSPNIDVPVDIMVVGDVVYIVTQEQPVGGQDIPASTGGRLWRMSKSGGNLTEIPLPDSPLDQGVSRILRDCQGCFYLFGGGAAGTGDGRPYIYFGDDLNNLISTNGVDLTGGDYESIVHDVVYDASTNRFYIALEIIGSPAGSGRLIVAQNGQVSNITSQVLGFGVNDFPAGVHPKELLLVDDDVLMMGTNTGEIYEARHMSTGIQMEFASNIDGTAILEMAGCDVRQIVMTEEGVYCRDLWTNCLFQQFDIQQLNTTPLGLGTDWISGRSMVTCDVSTRLFKGCNDFFFVTQSGQAWHLAPCSNC